MPRHTPGARSHAAWALGAIGGREAEAALRDALATETDSDVRDEIAEALDGAIN